MKLIITLLMCLGLVSNAYATNRTPPPTNPTPTTTSTTSSSSTDSTADTMKGVVIGLAAVCIGEVLYQGIANSKWRMCFSDYQDAPKDDGSIVPATANDSSTLYGVEVKEAK